MQTAQISSLAELEVGNSCRISAITLDGIIRRRIMDMGITPGVLVHCVRKSPAGDPIAFKVRNTVIALRSSDARFITGNK
jgi:ferrous iron transport protein A